MDRFNKIENLLSSLSSTVHEESILHSKDRYNRMQEYISDLYKEFIELKKIQGYTNASVISSTSTKKEMVNHPLHYQGLEVNGTNVECIDAMASLKGWFKTTIFCELNAFKYNWRVGEKDVIPQELGKIAWYGDKAKELWGKALHWLYPKNGHHYAIVDIGTIRMKNPTTGEWINAYLYTDGKGFYVRETEDFNAKFKLEK